MALNKRIPYNLKLKKKLTIFVTRGHCLYTLSNEPLLTIHNCVYVGQEALPWLWEKMSVAGSCSPSERRGGREHSTRGSSWGRVLTLKVNAWFTNAALISSIWRADAGLPFSNRISSPAFNPGGEWKGQNKVRNLKFSLYRWLLKFWKTASFKVPFYSNALQHKRLIVIKAMHSKWRDYQSDHEQTTKHHPTQ